MTIKEQIIDHENQLLMAMQTQDISILDRLLHENLLFNTPNGQTITKEIDLEGYRSGNVNFHTLTPYNLQISEFDNTVIVTVIIEIKGEYYEQKIEDKLRYLRIWKRQIDGWKVIGGSCINLTLNND
jgi:ketosteroid isomerase-like protein